MRNTLTQNQLNVNIDLNDTIVIRGIIKANRCGIQIVTRSEGSGFITATRQQVLGLEESLLSQGWRVNPSLYDEGFSARPEAVQKAIPFDGSATEAPAELSLEEWVGVR